MVQNQKSTKRDKLAILIDMLEVCRAPAKKTHILYRANINFYQLTRYLDLLVTTAMIEQVESQSKVYRITEKGLQFIRMFEPDDNMIEYLEKHECQLHLT
jgi:predicted transcriptional regulator